MPGRRAGNANAARLTDGLGVVITRTATVTVENPPAARRRQPRRTGSDVPVSTLLGWQASDPNCDELTYSVALGTGSTPPIVATGLTTPSFDPGRCCRASAMPGM
jgi:hypothetical protein